MKTRLVKTSLTDLIVVQIDYFQDERGFFIESWHKKDFKKAGLALEFVQEAHSRSRKNVLRGLHYQNMTAPMGKLVRCIYGKVFEVAVDLRMKSPTFGKWFSIELTADNQKQLYVPVGFALGFATLSDFAEVIYKQTGYYMPSAEGTIAWNDKDISIPWPIKNPILSNRDLNGISLSTYKKYPAFT